MTLDTCSSKLPESVSLFVINIKFLSSAFAVFPGEGIKSEKSAPKLVHLFSL